MKQFEFNKQFIQEHIDELVHLEDYVPFDFREYGKQTEREAFLKPKHLLIPLQNMHKLILEKCEYSDDPVKAWNSVIIEWLDCHPEFEGVISNESSVNYQNSKCNNQFIDFIDLLFDVELASEKEEEIDFSKLNTNESISIKDDSNIKYPNFKKMSECYNKYPDTLISSYLAYLV